MLCTRKPGRWTGPEQAVPERPLPVVGCLSVPCDLTPASVLAWLGPPHLCRPCLAENGFWQQIVTPGAPSPRAYLAAAAFEGHWYLFGGETDGRLDSGEGFELSVAQKDLGVLACPVGCPSVPPSEVTSGIPLVAHPQWTAVTPVVGRFPCSVSLCFCAGTDSGPGVDSLVSLVTRHLVLGGRSAP